MPVDAVISIQDSNRNRIERAHGMLERAVLKALQGVDDISSIQITIRKNGLKLGEPTCSMEFREIR